jgi:serine/threonine-protein phosphatase 2A regulatory subunit A
MICCWYYFDNLGQAAESITAICGILSSAQIEQHYIPLVFRLCHGDWFTSRTSSAALFSPVYPKATPATQDELRKAFAKLGADDTPMVRRAAAKWLGVREIVELLDTC